MITLVWCLLLLYLFFAGACVGSFLGVLISRVPTGVPFWRGRSRCDSCGCTLGARDLVPILSWCLLGGKCRRCGAPLSPRYPAIEAAGGVLSLWCFFHYAKSPLPGLLAFAVGALLLAVALVDLDTMLIPNGFVLSLLALGMLGALPPLSPVEVPLLSRVLGAAAVSLPMLLLALVIPGSFGGGDVKLMVPCGFLLGWKYALLAGFLALVIGGVQASRLLLQKKAGRGSQMPFGPALCAGVWLSLLYGEPILDWYLGFF